MPGSDLDATDGDVPAKPSIWQRLRAAIVKPTDEDDPGAASGTTVKIGDRVPTTVAELEEAVSRADDKERLVGLLLAPVAAAIALVVTGSLLAHDPKTLLANGQLNRLHVNPSLYLELGGVTLGLALLMLVMAWLRKRLYLGIVMALYGLSIFNLHFWGFGLPYILAGAWLLVRAYRLQTNLKQAKLANGGSGTTRSGASGASNKRYTPPSSRPAKSPKRKPGSEPTAG
jgi:hypothetical protein